MYFGKRRLRGGRHPGDPGVQCGKRESFVPYLWKKQALSFYDRGSGRSVRLVLKEKPREMTKAESFAYYQACEPREMFDVKETFLALPRKAEIFGSARCGCCGEMTGEKWLREAGGKKLCPDCLARLSGK